MTSTLKIDLSVRFPGMATREIGDAALAEMVGALRESDVVELDFGGRSPSPSFADQAVGSLAAYLGLAEFKRRVRIKNAPDDTAPLLRHVILRKIAMAKKSG